MLSRRALVGSLISLVAAPAIVRVSSIMPVKLMEPKIIGGLASLDMDFSNAPIRAIYRGCE